MIKNIEQIERARDFTGIPIGATDIDGLQEYKNKAYVISELKTDMSGENREITLNAGQGLALTRLCDDLGRLKPTILIVSTHPAGKEPIMVKDTIVNKFRYYGHWYYPKRRMTFLELMNKFIDKVNSTKLPDVKVTQVWNFNISI